MSILQDGQILTAQNGQRWRIEKLLGSGMTAEVYQAVSLDESRPPVALKHLRPGVVADVRALFFAEAENLQRVYQAWEDAKNAEGILGQLTRSLPFPAPRLHGVSEEPPFILMDLVQGEPLADFLQTQGEEEEKERFILGLGVHLGTLLWVLHERARRCYSDMKIENFWWVGEETAPALLLTDWNVLNEVGEEWVQRDLFLATLMLYTWLTGDVLPRQRLQITVPLGTVPTFQQVSRGVQQFLRRALSPTMEMRYATAREWTLALWEILQWWRMEEHQLADELTRRFNEIRNLDAKIREQEAQGAPPRELVLAQAEAYRVFGSMLDVADWRVMDVPDEYRDAFSHYSEQLSPQGIGLRALQGLSYDLALEQFERGASLFPAEMVAYRHWWTLANGARRMPMDRFRAIRERVVEGVKKANAQQWQEAKVLLDEAAAAVAEMDIEAWRRFLNEVAEGRESLREAWRGNGVILLDVEAWVAVWYREAEAALQRGDHERAQVLARKAQALVNLLPADEHHAWYVQHSEIAALEDRATRQMQAAARESEIWQTWQDARHQKRWDKVLEALRNAWDWLPEERGGRVAARWEETARQMWEEGEAEALRQLVGRWAALAQEETKNRNRIWQHLATALSHLHLLRQTREKGIRVDESSSQQWRTLLEEAKALDWGAGLLPSEANAWEEALLEQGEWAGWSALMAVWATVDWAPWQEYLRALQERASRHLSAYLANAVKRLEELAALLVPEMDTPTLAIEVQREVRSLQRRLAGVRDLPQKEVFENRLQQIQTQITTWLTAYRQKEAQHSQKRTEAWKQLDSLLGGGLAIPASYYWSAMVRQADFLLALGERQIPDDFRNVRAYYQAFVGNQPASPDGVPLERLRQHLLNRWVQHTDVRAWFTHLEFLKAQGKWDEIYWWADRLMRYLSTENSPSEETRQQLESWRAEALDVLAFLKRFSALPASAAQSSVAV